MKEIAKKVYFERGHKNGAIYNLNDSNVYSVNEEACKIIQKLFCHSVLNDEEIRYVDKLRSLGLYVENFCSDNSNKINLIKETFDTVWLEITQACNMRCLHCYEGCTHIAASSEERLSLEQWKQIIDEITELGAKRIVVIGGEPAIDKNICEILTYLSEKKQDVTLFTNASFTNENLKNIICNHKIRIKFSIYGHNAEIHDKITQHPGSFDLLISNISFFLEKNVDVSAAVVLMKENENFLYEIDHFLKNIGIKKIKFDVIREVFSGKQSEHLPVTPKVLNLRKIKEPYFTLSLEHFLLFNGKNTCWNRKLVISEDGTILPCVFARSEHVGNVKQQSLKMILNSEKLRYYWNFSFDYVEKCKECEFKYACKDCRPLAMSVRGFISDKNPRCCYDPISGEWKNE